MVFYAILWYTYYYSLLLITTLLLVFLLSHVCQHLCEATKAICLPNAPLHDPPAQITPVHSHNLMEVYLPDPPAHEHLRQEHPEVLEVPPGVERATGPGRAKVSDLESEVLSEQDVIGPEVVVQHALVVEVVESPGCLGDQAEQLPPTQDESVEVHQFVQGVRHVFRHYPVLFAGHSHE